MISTPRRMFLRTVGASLVVPFVGGDLALAQSPKVKSLCVAGCNDKATAVWKTVLIMPEAQSLQPIPGRFIATTVLLWEEGVRAQLDPRGKDARPDALDEAETSRFLTNLRRVVRKRPEAVTVSSAEYLVTV